MSISESQELEPSAVEASRSGEDSQDTGLVGLRTAKVWLDRTTRVSMTYTNQQRGFKDLLAFPWPHGNQGTFTYDIGGSFAGGNLDNQTFVGEVKKYKREGNLPEHFRDFVAKSYVAYRFAPRRCDHFLWISWAPFQAQKWDEHCTYEKVVSSLSHRENITRSLGLEPGDDALPEIDHQAAAEVAGRIWLITLSDRQDDLNLLDKHYSEIIGKIAIEREGQS